MKARRRLIFSALTALLLSIPIASFGQISIGIAVNVAPPALPVYDQPICPGPNYIWTPGYWAWSGYDYYWVPGTWIVAPSYGLLWTPGYWGWGTGGYLWHGGYWGPHIGFYGGVNYGFGYYGGGYEGGYWRGNSFYYNTAVSHVNTTVIRNVYVNKTVINNVTVNRVSYNGGHGGITARPTPQQQTALNERRMGPVGAQATHEQLARQDTGNFYKSNHGAPPHAALARPATSVNDFRSNAVAARPVAGANNRPENVNRPANNAARPETRPTTAARPENTARPSPETRPAPASRPENTSRPQTQTRPAPQQQHPATQTARPETRPAPTQQARPEQQQRPAAQPRPEPQARPEAQPRPSEPHGDEHPHP
jgi:WXXGXW repeat (2 copies)